MTQVTAFNLLLHITSNFTGASKFQLVLQYIKKKKSRSFLWVENRQSLSILFFSSVFLWGIVLLIVLPDRPLMSVKHSSLRHRPWRSSQDKLNFKFKQTVHDKTKPANQFCIVNTSAKAIRAITNMQFTTRTTWLICQWSNLVTDKRVSHLHYL